jgi:23S rRNA pseudouridine2605 synthase
VIEAGRVTVDGQVVRFPLRRLDPRREQVAVDGRRVGDDTERIVIALHKPVGLITSRTDPGGRPTVYELLGDVGRWVFPVGRLDRDTSGLLVLTNDHRLGQTLTDPAHHVPKTYHVRVKGLPSPEALRVLREGAPLGPGEVSRPARVRGLGSARGGTWLEIVLTEGKNRQVRRMCAAVGHEVIDLVRVRIGRLPLGALPVGKWRRLGAAEIASLAALA